MLYTLVSDAAENSGKDDPTWLDAAIEVMEDSEPGAQVELRIVLDIIGRDYQLPAVELRRLHSAVDQVQPGPSLHDYDFPAELLKERILAILKVCERYEDMLEERSYY